MGITPTVGRNVYYTPHNEHDYDLQVFDPLQPCLAFITCVRPDNRVNLLVLDQGSQGHARLDIEMVQPEQAKSEAGGYAYWMPYQVGKVGA